MAIERASILASSGVLALGIGQNLVPDWVRADAEWDVMKDPDYGRIAII